MTRRTLACLGLAAVALAAGPAVARGQTRNWPTESLPAALAAKPVTFPPYEVRSLANGLKVVVVEQHEQPAVSLRLLVAAGTAQDTMPTFGVANMVALLLDQGTATRTARQFADAVDSIGGSASTGAGTDLTFASLVVLKDGFGQGLNLLAEMVRAPAFAQDEFERERDRLRSTLRVDARDPDFLASVVFERLVYGFHSYAFPGTGTPESIARITRRDLQEFHEQYFAPNNCILAVVGDVTTADAFATVEKAFGSWAPRDVVFTMMLQPPPAVRRVVVIDVPDAVQTEIRVGQLGVRRQSNDYTAVDLAVRVLGGEGANRLQRVLRVQRGLAYDASADLNAFRYTGDIAAETETHPLATGEALRVMVDEFSRLQRQKVSARELGEAKAFLAGSFPLGIETPDDIATKILTSLFYGLPVADLDTFRERVSAVTPDDIERVTRTYVHPERLSVVLVGPATAFLGELQRLGFRNVDVVPVADLDVTAADLRRPPGSGFTELAGPAAVTMKPGLSREAWDRAKTVLGRAAAAAGGLDALRSVRTLRATATTVMGTPDGPMRATTRTYVAYPGRMRVDATLPAGDIVQAYVDGSAWLKDRTGVRDAPKRMRDEFAQGLRRDWIALLLAAADDRVMGRQLPDEKGVGGRPLNVVEVWGQGLAPVRVAIDGSTALIAWISYQSEGPGGPVTIKESFGDYRAVNGIQIPYTAVVRRDSVVMLERALTDVQINVAFPPAFFDKIQ
jgi:zinc protease